MNPSSQYQPVVNLPAIKPPQIQLQQQRPAGSSAIAVLLPTKTTQLPEALRGLNAELNGALELARQHGDFKGRPGDVAVCPLDHPSRRLLLGGLGQSESLDADQIRWTAASIARKARQLRLRGVSIYLQSMESIFVSNPQLLEALAEGLTLGCFEYTPFKAAEKEAGDVKATPATMPTFHLILTTGKRHTLFHQAIATGTTIAQSANYARYLACHPGNVVNPATLVREARALARNTGLRVEIIDHNKAVALGMGGLLSVGQGSASPPALILLEYKPPSIPRAGRSAKPVVLVGKAVTFDTGGISIKPAPDMGLMKFDKCGGMAVLGAMKAIAALQLPIPVIGAIPTAENSVDALAYRPGDIIRMYNGKTVEVTNTDAEGRLILADAVNYVCRRYHPGAVIDLATLTGGVIVALGSVYAGLMSNRQTLAQALQSAGTYSGEWLWPLPLHDRYATLLESPHADIANSGPREAHPIQGGMFLRHFVPAKIPWAHLDIAGTSHPKKDDRYLVGKSASGFGVRLLVEYLRHHHGQEQTPTSPR